MPEETTGTLGLNCCKPSWSDGCVTLQGAMFLMSINYYFSVCEYMNTFESVRYTFMIYDHWYQDIIRTYIYMFIFKYIYIDIRTYISIYSFLNILDLSMHIQSIPFARVAAIQFCFRDTSVPTFRQEGFHSIEVTYWGGAWSHTTGCQY